MASQSIAVVGGLSVGIGFVLLFAIEMAPTENSSILPTTPHIDLSIDGLRHVYHVGEPIHFSFRVAGYGYYCQSPNAAIWNASGFLKSFPVWRSGLPTVFCLHGTGIKPPNRYIADTYDWSSYSKIAIQSPGNYTLGVRFEDERVANQTFVVVP